MNFSTSWFPLVWQAAAFVPVLAVLAATWKPAWQAVHTHQRSVAAALCILAVLWSLRAGVPGGQLHGMNYHLLGISLITLMVGAPAAVWLAAAMMACYTVLLHGWGNLPVLGLNVLLTVLPAVAVCRLLQLLVQKYLPDNLFIYIFINGFVAAALGMLLTGSLLVGLLGAAQVYPGVSLWSTAFMVFFLITWGEAFLSGILTAIFVALAPQLLSSFDDERYLRRQSGIWK